MSELSQTLDDLIACGEKLIATAQAIRRSLSTPEPPPKTYAFIDVRKAFAEKANHGFTEQVRDLITRYGATRLSELKEEDYPAIMAELEAIQ